MFLWKNQGILLAVSLFCVAQSEVAATGHGRHQFGTKRLLPLITSTRGGAKQAAPAPPPAPVSVDFEALASSLKSRVKQLWNHEKVQEAMNLSPADVVTKVGSFVGKQRQAANDRRQAYRDNSSLNQTSTAILSAPRALKLTLLAFCVAELVQFIELNTAPVMGTVAERSKEIKADLAYQWDNFYQVGRSEGGLLRAGTYTNLTTLAMAVQEQVEPKYQWALGAAAGFVLSPLAWSLGWTALGWSAAVYLLAETHHWFKVRLDKYYYTLKEWNNPVIFAVDDALEDLRKIVYKTVQAPKETIMAMRDDIDERIDFEFPPHMQKGLLFGAVVGVVTGA